MKFYKAYYKKQPSQLLSPFPPPQSLVQCAVFPGIYTPRLYMIHLHFFGSYIQSLALSSDTLLRRRSIWLISLHGFLLSLCSPFTYNFVLFWDCLPYSAAEAGLELTSRIGWLPIGGNFLGTAGLNHHTWLNKMIFISWWYFHTTMWLCFVLNCFSLLLSSLLYPVPCFLQKVPPFLSYHIYIPLPLWVKDFKWGRSG